jgi:mono/diheme cytochrome c family protein
MAAAPWLCASPAPGAFRAYCFTCHGKAAMAGLNLEQLTAGSVGDHFQRWEKVAAALESRRMPPAKMKQPSEAERAEAVQWIRGEIKAYALKNAGDPGRVTVRRLTSGEYAYTIKDLTGLDFRSDQDFVADEVGGEGFTNFGDVQFLQDSSLERYLSSAKWVAARAVIGAGPLQFYQDPGRTGMELSAINRIYAIYNRYGFRASSGEGGTPFGLDRYSKALYAAWRFQHRAALGEPRVTMAQLSAREGLLAPFVEHIWAVMQKKDAQFPTAEVISRFQKLPAAPVAEAKIRAACDEIRDFMIEWPRWLLGAGEQAAGGLGDERALILTSETVQAAPRQKLSFSVIRRDKTDRKTIPVYLSLGPANPLAKDRPYVIWRKGTIRLLGKDRKLLAPQPLRSALTEASVRQLGFGRAPDGQELAAGDFATAGDASFEVVPPDGQGSFQLQVEAEIGPGEDNDAVIRCTISDRPELNKGRPFSVLVARTDSPSYQEWKRNVLAFAADLPLNSHSEANPSDKDPIPAPFDNTYNQPERDSFHTTLKYHRGDGFLAEKMLDEPTRLKLAQAWDDLLSSFNYHDTFLQFLSRKYKLNWNDRSIRQLSAAEIAALPAEPRQYVAALRAEYDGIARRKAAAQPRHVEDCFQFASAAWRRPLSVAEQESLKHFYWSQRETLKLDHESAVRALVARILVAPAFLYKLERPAAAASVVKPLSGAELASRLSYFLWSSPPDGELLRAARAGELTQPAALARQVKRMMADAKARRFAVEFFGQWLGFYRFDQFRGIDAGRFPEFTDEIKTAMYDEAVSFFEYMVRQERPVREMFSADYTFLNKNLAKFYGVKLDVKSSGAAELARGVNADGRGGVLRLGAVHAVTSAPLRTSPVKRGDWVLRRLLGTPTPPPPADAGSIPADEKNFGGLSLREKLAAHKRNATCAGCHDRIDPLGFPFERYDSIGRVREKYPDGKPVDDRSVTLDQTAIRGVDGLLAYLRKQDELVLKNLSHKLLGYALGRTVLVSDQPLIERLSKLGADATFVQLATEIVTSRQFMNRREGADPMPATSAPAAVTASTGTGAQ